MNPSNLPSQRQIRFGEVIRKIVSEAITKDFVVNGENDLSIVTVSFVKMSKDLRNASIYIMPLGGENKNKNHHKKYRLMPSPASTTNKYLT